MSGAVQGSCLLTDRACYTKISFFDILFDRKKSSFFRSRLGSRSPSAGPLEARIELREVDEAPTQLEDGSKHGSWQKLRYPKSSRDRKVGVGGDPL